MNNISIVGRITKDIELTQTNTGIKLCRFNVAVPSEFKDTNGEKKADFFSCVAWKEIAERIVKYFKKGNPIGLVGFMNNREYKRQDGTLQNIWELNIKSFSFVCGQSEIANENKQKPKETGDEYDDCPF